MNGLGFVVLEVAAVALVLALLNERDRRRARAIAAVPGALSVPERGRSYLTRFMAWACGGSGSR
jgi:hypothetical protein